MRRLLRAFVAFVVVLAALVGAYWSNLLQRGLLLVDGSRPQVYPLSTAPEVFDQVPVEVRVVTANVLCYGCESEGQAPGPERRRMTAEFLRLADADLIGLQELVSDSDCAAVGLDPGCWELAAPVILGLTYADAAIFFRRSRFERLESGAAWLGRDPELPLSASWTLAFPRYVNWVLLRDRSTGGELIFANTHFDPQRANKDRSARAFVEVVRRLQLRAPTIVAGDFNTAGSAKRFAVLSSPPIRETLHLVDPDHVTVDPWWFDHPLDRVIDHVFISTDRVQVRSWGLDDVPERSDHPYLTVDLELLTRSPRSERRCDRNDLGSASVDR